jgi:hypothetical protein
VILRVENAYRFVPASVALRVAPAPRVTSFPGAPPELVGVTLYEGLIVPVVSIGPERREMVLCQHSGELVGVVGGEVVQTGSFDLISGRADCVVHDGQYAQLIDLTAIYGRVLAGVRPGTWAR